MVDRLVVQTQDTIRVLKQQQGDDAAVSSEISNAESLIRDADNSKQVLLLLFFFTATAVPLIFITFF